MYDGVEIDDKNADVTMKDNSLRQKLNSCSKVHGYSSVCAILLLQFVRGFEH